MIQLFVLLLSVLPASAAPRTVHLVFQNGALHGHCAWQNGPNPSPAESRLKLEWHDGRTHQNVEAPGEFRVSLFMPEHGHGSSPTQINRVLDEQGRPLLGVYEVTGMYFTMPGNWEVRVSLRNADGIEETQKFSVRL